MSLIEIFLLAFALGIDCLIASFSQGLIFKSKRVKNSLNLAATMGLFQGLMPIIGYMGTDKIYDFLMPHTKQIVFGIFLILGIHFILDSFSKKEKQVECIGLKCLMGLGLATSIDALISGSTIKLTHTSVLTTCLVIGFLSFLMSLTGFWIGHFIKNIQEKFLGIFGGGILLFLAFKALFI